MLNKTHDPALRSWVTSANDGKTDFPIQNLPFCQFRLAGSLVATNGGIAIGDQVLDMRKVAALCIFEGDAQRGAEACAESTLNNLMSMGQPVWSALRAALSEALTEGSPRRDQLTACLVPQTEVEYGMPCRVGDYTDFYTSVYHATSVGKLFRPDNPLLPNYKWIPIGYHGRASSIGVSGQTFPRPVGQTKAPDASEPSFGPAKRMDYELELGVFMGPGNALGDRISIEQAEQHVFGICLFNDWSARDLQAWEYQPLGPFLAKNFASTISPWIVTMEALAPFRAPFSHPADDPQPLPYLDSDHNRNAGALDIELEVLLTTAKSRSEGTAPMRISRSNYKDAYWTVAQMVAHHTVNGCNMMPGDLLGSGTLSGPTPDSAGALLELCVGGKQPIILSNGESRTFLEDYDEVIIRGYCLREGAARIGFGHCAGTMLPAKPL